jgi:hypothetical protein
VIPARSQYRPRPTLSVLPPAGGAPPGRGAHHLPDSAHEFLFPNHSEFAADVNSFPCEGRLTPIVELDEEEPRPGHRDNTVTTNALSTRSRSSIVPDEMGVSAAVLKDGQVARKVEGLVVRLDRGSSNLPGRIFPSLRGFLNSPASRAETAGR